MSGAELYYNLSLVIGGFVAAISGAVVFFNGPRRFENVSWFILNIIAAIWSFGYFSLITAVNKEVAWVSNWILHTAAIFIPYLYFLFIIALTDTFQHHKRKLFYLAALVVFFLAINPTELFIRDVFPKYIFRFAPDAGPLYKYFAAYFVFLPIYGLTILYKKLKGSIGQEKERFKYIFYISIIGFPGGASVFLLTFNINFPPYPLVLFFTYPIVVTYAILRRHLFNARVVTTEIFIFAIWVFLLTRVLLTDTLRDGLINGGLLFSIIVLGIFLIRSVQREVRSRERIEELAKQLEEANVELKKLDAAKSEFISLASHQLRTPLTIVKGYVSMMQEGSFGKQDERTQKVLQRVYDANEHLVKLVADFLNLSRIEAGKLKYIVEPVNMPEMVEEIVENLRGAAEQKHLELRWLKPAENIPRVEMDKEKIHQSVFNLMDNAIKYTEKGFVEAGIRLADKGRAVEIFVHDSGMGLSAADKEKLFQKFSRASGGATNTSGLGIGLYLAAKMVQDHAGKIWAESEGAGKGSTFIIQLPVHSHLAVERGELMERKAK